MTQTTTPDEEPLRACSAANRISISFGSDCKRSRGSIKRGCRHPLLMILLSLHSSVAEYFRRFDVSRTKTPQLQLRHSREIQLCHAYVVRIVSRIHVYYSPCVYSNAIAYVATTISCRRAILRRFSLACLHEKTHTRLNSTHSQRVDNNQ